MKPQKWLIYPIYPQKLCCYTCFLTNATVSDVILANQSVKIADGSVNLCCKWFDFSKKWDEFRKMTGVQTGNFVPRSYRLNDQLTGVSDFDTNNRDKRQAKKSRSCLGIGTILNPDASEVTDNL